MINKGDKERSVYMVGLRRFVLSTTTMFFIISSFLFAIDFVPELQKEEEQQSSIVKEIQVDTVVASTSQQTVNVLAQHVAVKTDPQVPVRVTIATIGLDTTIITPSSADIAVLDRALVSGAVHYPGSGLLDENANMLLFGHSSYLPVVKNKAYKAFNELGKLKLGDVVLVYSKEYVYRYIVETVQLSEAEDALVTFESSRPKITLATCNTFGTKQERWVVTASYVSKELL